MTINSFTLRPIFKRTNNDPMRRDRRNPHRWIWRDPSARPAKGELALEGSWDIQCRLDDTRTADCVRQDISDFLCRMNVDCRPGADNVIEVKLAKDLDVRNCRYACQPGRIVISGGDMAGVWAGIAWVEQEMRIRRGPFLAQGETVRRAAWPVQMSANVWGANYSMPDLDPEYLGDDSFRLYAHYGVNVMMLHGDLLCYVKSDILPELNHPDYEHRPRYAEATFHIGENGSSMVMHSLPDDLPVVPNNPDEDVWDIVVREYHRAAEESALALKCLREAQKVVTQPMDNHQLHEEILLVELIWRTMMACENTVRFLMARRDYEKNGDEKSLVLMKTIARADKENAMAAAPIYREARWLDVCERTDHRVPHSSLEMIDQKIRWIDEFLNKPKT